MTPTPSADVCRGDKKAEVQNELYYSEINYKIKEVHQELHSLRKTFNFKLTPTVSKRLTLLLNCSVTVENKILYIYFYLI